MKSKLEIQLKVIDDIYAMSPTKNFINWKPEDALAFYQRLKSYERKLRAMEGDKVNVQVSV